ncbi:hypothetical protein Q8A73_014701 [Channa argus]|nr:hypothetical protein Q8A73_014701 [Channa argus]
MGRVERLLTPHSHLSVRLPSSRHPPVSCLLSAALRPCHLGDTPDHQGPGGRLGLASGGPHHGNMGEKFCSVWGSGADNGLVVGRKEDQGMIKCGRVLTLKIVEKMWASNNVVCLPRTEACHKSNHSKLHHDIYFYMGGPLYIVELSDSRM